MTLQLIILFFSQNYEENFEELKSEFNQKIDKAEICLDFLHSKELYLEERLYLNLLIDYLEHFKCDEVQIKFKQR